MSHSRRSLSTARRSSALRPAAPDPAASCHLPRAAATPAAAPSNRPTSRRSPRRPRPSPPPFCPNTKCPFHHPRPDWTFRREGFYRSALSSRPLQRFRCLHCRRKFSRQTFSTSYWLHKPHLLLPITDLSVQGACLRQIARALSLSHATVAAHLARAARHCLLFHRSRLSHLSHLSHLSRLSHLSHLSFAPPPEPIAFDGFESFVHSQFFPFHFNLAAGSQSWFLYHFTHSPLRRKGRMTPAQRLRRQELEATLGRPDPKAVEKGVYQLLRLLLGPHPAGPFLCYSDEHPAYRRALRRLRREHPQLRLTHRLQPSTAPRGVNNPLHPVNLADLLLRHSSANHHRETIGFSKILPGAVDRMAVFLVWRNYVKWRREKRPGETAAMAAGVVERPLGWGEIFRHRLFPSRRQLPGGWWSYYWGRVTTRPGERPVARHRLRYAA